MLQKLFSFIYFLAWGEKCFLPSISHECVVPENIYTHPMDGHWKCQGGRGCNKAKLEFLEGLGVVGGGQTKNHSWGGGSTKLSGIVNVSLLIPHLRSIWGKAKLFK